VILSRRDALRAGLGVGAALSLPGIAAGCARGGANLQSEGSAGSVLRSEAPLPEPFGVPLPVPPVLQPTRSDGAADYYEITQRISHAEILPGQTTEILGYDGIFPGPTIESRRGRATVVRHRNELDTPTVVHLHGGRTPPEHDGYPTDLVLPADGWEGEHPHGGEPLADGSWDYEYPVDQPAATLWYHDHSMDFTGPKVYRGLAGFHLVRDDEEEALDLPSGDRDIPLMICDRAFAADGSFDYPARDHAMHHHPGTAPDFISGVLGDCILVNGAPWPVLEVTNTRYRFRILNASNARRYRLALDPPPPGGASFTQIGSDAGLLSAPVTHREIEIAQAERFDVVIDFSQYELGSEITLTNTFGRDGTARVMRFVVTRRATEDSHVPATLADVRPLQRSDATIEREFRFARGGASHDGITLWTVNGKAFDPERIDAEPELGAVELWKIRSLNVHHPIHIHLAHFQVLTVGGGSGDVGPFNAGWKDTIDLNSGGQAELLVKFDGYRGKYVFHCHNLEHEDMMMMANFEVV
jgi:spore coat protein A, manganese oxidase